MANDAYHQHAADEGHGNAGADACGVAVTDLSNSDGRTIVLDILNDPSLLGDCFLASGCGQPGYRLAETRDDEKYADDERGATKAHGFVSSPGDWPASPIA